MKRFIAFICTVVLCASLLFCTAAEQTQAQITILHTNDMHGYYKQVVQKDTPTTVGFEFLKGLANDADLLLDAGDTFHGQAFATVDKGTSIAALMQSLGYDAFTPGNHDFNYGYTQLSQLQTLSEIPFLAANIVQEDGTPLFDDTYLVRDIKGVRVGLFGVIDDSIYDSIAVSNVSGICFEDDVTAAARVVSALKDKEQCDIVICLTHRSDCAGFVSETEDIDLVVAGHEHQVMQAQYPDKDGDLVTVVETGSFFANAGMVTIQYDFTQNKITDISSKIIAAADTAMFVPDEQILQQILQLENVQNQTLSQVFAQSGVSLPYSWEEIRCDEQPLGRVITSAYLNQVPEADIAVENAGGIRAGLNIGDITKKDVISISPFGNTLETKALTGEQVLQMLERSVDIGISCRAVYDLQLEALANGEDPYQYEWPDKSGSYLQFGGVCAVYDMEKPFGQRVSNVTVKGKPIQKEKTYVVVMNSYTATDSVYPMIAQAQTLHTYGSCENALIAYFESISDEMVRQAAQTVGIRKTVAEVVPEVPEVPEPEIDDIKTPETSDAGNMIYLTLLVSALGMIIISVKRRRTDDE